MSDQFERTRRLIGKENLSKLADARVLVFGVGGVGGYVCEALARAGVGTIDIVDKDVVDITNINRQIIATHDTIGQPKVEACRRRMISINPLLKCDARECFYLPERASDFDFAAYDYVVDAVDNVTAKIDIICRSKEAGTAVISSMGTGNKLDPTMFRVSDIEKTKVCPLAKVVRKELKNRGIRGVKVLYSEEEPVKVIGPDGQTMRTPASISFVPSAAGLIIAGEVIKDIIKTPL
ncbi:MAG: tRNA threonylcarbamoyladenosine dehydratase [Firmicutes bacterium]|nr:tRNA threonylcarbamoyladenosine dehydratase [Bacillota bacterium]